MWKRVGKWGRRYTEVRVTDPKKKRRIPRHLWWGVGIPLILVVVATFRGPALHEDWMRGNEWSASAALKTLATAEANFRSNDRDGNKVNDYWTADVTGLWHVKQLIEREVAEADAAPLKALVDEPVPYHGYYFVALERDLYVAGAYPGNEYYKGDTDNSGLKVHNPRRFGFCAYPAHDGWTGRWTGSRTPSRTIGFVPAFIARSSPRARGRASCGSGAIGSPSWGRPE